MITVNFFLQIRKMKKKGELKQKLIFNNNKIIFLNKFKEENDLKIRYE